MLSVPDRMFWKVGSGQTKERYLASLKGQSHKMTMLTPAPHGQLCSNSIQIKFFFYQKFFFKSKIVYHSFQHCRWLRRHGVRKVMYMTHLACHHSQWLCRHQVCKVIGHLVRVVNDFADTRFSWISRKIDKFSKAVLACLYGAQVVFWNKNECWKSRDTVPLRCDLLLNWNGF